MANFLLCGSTSAKLGEVNRRNKMNNANLLLAVQTFPRISSKTLNKLKCAPDENLFSSKNTGSFIDNR